MKPNTSKTNVPGLVRVAIVLLAGALVAACSGGPLGLPGGNDDGTLRFDTVEGTVESVDTRRQSVVVNADDRSPVAAGQRVDLYYDDRTTVKFDGRDYRPQDLERGDRIVADVQENGRYLDVEAIVVTDDATPNDTPVAGVARPDITGTLVAVDSRDRTLFVELGDSGVDTRVTYDSRTRVYLHERVIEASELRRGDRIEVELVPGSRTDLANVITVVESGDLPGDEQTVASVRGSVVTVDDRRGELVISTRDALVSSFDVGRNDTVTFRYERDVPVLYRGETYSPDALERGDGVDVAYEPIGDDLWVREIRVTSNVRN